MDLHRMQLLRNPIRNYDWGSRTVIADLLGEPSPSAEPQAELWMGAHPSAPSMVVTEAGEVPLDEWIARDPEGILGADVATRFDEKLPFMCKVLAVEKPLSVQAHPNRQQAAEGFARENAAGIPIDAPHRCYRDSNHKPELICALTPFQVLSRFRETQEIGESFAALGAPEVDDALKALGSKPGRDERAAFLRSLMGCDGERRRAILDRAAMIARSHADEVDWFWVNRLMALFPDDMGALAPLFLNHMTLEPGEALHQPAGELHCYLGGTAIEIMANSDNVLRGGLTSKHIDLDALCGVLSFDSGAPEQIRPEQTRSGEQRYTVPAEEFELIRHHITSDVPQEIPCDRGAELLLCTEGSLQIQKGEGGGSTSLQCGSSAFVSAAVSSYLVEGCGTLYRATVGKLSD